MTDIELGSESEFNEEEEEEEYFIEFDQAALEEYVEEEEGEDLLNKNTDSFKCLMQLIVSHSSIFRDPYYVFPPLKDPLLDEAINYTPPGPVIDDIGAEEYKRLCNEYGIVPISRIISSLPTNTLNLKYYGLSHKQIVALTEALKVNVHVEDLILQDNWMDIDSVHLLANTLNNNNTIKYLNLRECRIGPEGAAQLNDGLMMCRSLKYLDLAFNNLGDAGLIALADALLSTGSITQLDLSHNMLGDGAGETLEDILRFNNSILDLNLSWNNFYTGVSMKCLGKGLLENKNLLSLNLSWNAISTSECTKPLNKYLKKTKTLQFLDVSNNRLTGPPLKGLRIAIRRSKTLLAAKLGNNPIKSDEAQTIAKALIDGKSVVFIDLENVFVDKSFIPLLQRIKFMKKAINFGGVYSNYVINGPDELKLLFQRAIVLGMKPKKKKKQRNFGHVVLNLPDKDNMPRADFDKFVKKQKIKMIDKDLLNAIIERFSGKNKTLNALRLKEAFMSYYPDTKLPPPKKKNKGKKKGKKKPIDSEVELEEEEEEEFEIAKSIMADTTQVREERREEVAVEQTGPQTVEQEEAPQQERTGSQNETEQVTETAASEAAPGNDSETPENQASTKRPSESAPTGNNPN